MASEQHSDQPPANERKLPRDMRPPPAVVPILNDGLESLRSRDC